jgi:Rv2525c-like, glycoside hydrolase-like domain
VVSKRSRKTAARKTRPGRRRHRPIRKKKKTRKILLEAPLIRAAGFDTGSYPGNDAIRAWATNSSYQFVGFYFDAPCHSTKTFKSWSGKSAFIRSTGLGLVIVYVGFQQDGCGKNKLSRAAGTSHGEDTIAKCKAEGFAAGTIVFLDVENYSGALSAAMADYIRGWIGALLDEGTVGPGIYCPARKAKAIQTAAKKEYAEHGRPDDAPAFWIVKVTDHTFNTATSVPSECGVAFANVWQGVIDVQEEHGNVTMKIDQNVADSSNPSMA